MGFIAQNWVSLSVMIAFAVVLRNRNRIRGVQIRYIWITLLLAFVWELVDWVEIELAGYPSMRLLRIGCSVMGYWVRTGSILSLLNAMDVERKRRKLLWVPQIISMVVMGSAFFTDLAFGYNENYMFTRGPLGITVFLVAFVYMLVFIPIAKRRYDMGRTGEVLAIGACIISGVGAMTLDAILGGNRTNEVMVICAVFHYLFLYTKQSDKDPITELFNRQAFYTDLALYDSSITSLMSVDMNGLKRINDSYGHDAGDRAIMAVAKVLRSHTGQDVIAYRMGGDEFVLAIRNQNEEQVRQIMDAIRREIRVLGLSVSAGYAMRLPKENLEFLYKRSDEALYEDKNAYYQDASHERRKR